MEDFDFYRFTYDYLKENTYSGFLSRSYVFTLLGRRYSLEKCLIRQVLRQMKEKGLIRQTKRGILLIGDANGG